MRAFIGQDLSDDEIWEEIEKEGLDWSYDDILNLRRDVLLEEESRLSRRLPGEVYAEHALRTHEALKSLKKIVASCLESNQASAAVGAIKAGFDIYNKHLKFGQVLGYVPDRPTGEEDKQLGKASIAELNVMLVAKLESLTIKIRNYGDIPFTNLPVPAIGKSGLQVRESKPSSTKTFDDLIGNDASGNIPRKTPRKRKIKRRAAKALPRN